jgi:hypothetical protein
MRNGSPTTLCQGKREAFMMAYRMGTALMMAVALQAAAAFAAEPALDYEFYKARVEPIFLKKKEGHTRCVVCHAESNNAFRLQKLSPGAKTWTDEQSRANFEVVSRLLVPGNLAASRLLIYPLAPEAGGHVFHSGGRQFTSQDDPDWKTIQQWANGRKPAAGKKG